MKTRTCLWALLVVSCFALVASDACAQGRNGIGSAQQGGLGQNVLGAFGAAGQAGAGQSQLGLGQQAGGLGQSGNIGGFGGQGSNLGRPPVGGQDVFVGSDAEQLRNQQQNPRRRRRAMFDFAIESLNEMRESRRQRNSQRNRPPPVRVQLRPLFRVQQPTATELTTQVRTRLAAALPTTVGVSQITVSGSTATIRGTVTSDYDRQLATKMLSLQPGISQVDNQLTIGQLTIEQGQEAPLLVPSH